MSDLHVQDHVFVISGRLVRGHPTSLNDVYLATFHQFFKHLFLLFINVLIPHCQKFDICNAKSASRILNNLVKYRIEHDFGGSMSVLIQLPRKIFVRRLVPTCIHVRVCNQMNSNGFVLVRPIRHGWYLKQALLKTSCVVLFNFLLLCIFCL